MKATHKLYRWFRWHGARKFDKGSPGYLARIKKDGRIMYWVGVHRVCMGPYPPYICYFWDEKDANTIRWNRHKDSFGKVKKYQTYFTLEKL